MFEHQRVGLVVYGSLLDPADLCDLFGDLSGRLRPVTVSGFQRRFDQAASWRETDGHHRAVLNVAPDGDHWFNGLLIGGITRAELRTYRQRERGYRLVEIAADELEPYGPGATVPDELAPLDDRALDAHDIVFTATGTKPDPDILPVASYVERCLSGAESWGQQFRREFRSTTMVNTGQTLGKYLSADESD